MTIDVKMQDGTILRFPDGTSQDTMRTAIQAMNPNPVADAEAGTYRPMGNMPEGGSLQEPAGGVSVNRPAADELAIRLGAMSEGAANGVTFGFLDNLAGGARAVLNPSNMRQSYIDGRDASRASLAQNQEQYPGESMFGNIAGGAASSALLAPATAGKTALGTVGRMIGVGATEGTLFGGGNSNADTWGQLGADALKGTGVGAGIGLAAPALGALLRYGPRFARGAVDTATGAASPARANRAVQRMVDRSGMTPAQIATRTSEAAAQGQPMYMTADAMGITGQRGLAGVARQPGAARAEIAAYLNKRQANQGDRMGSFVADALDAPDTAMARRAAMTKDRRADAATNYDDASAGAGPVNLNGALDVIDRTLRRDPILGDTALSQGPLGARMSALRDRMQKGGEQLIEFDTVKNLRTDIRHQMDANPRQADDLRKVYDQLDAALEEASDGYRLANDTYARQSRNIDAIDEGTAMASNRRRAADTNAQFAAMTPEQRAANNVGYSDPLLARIEAVKPGANRADPLLSDKVQAELGTRANDPARLMAQVRRESEMFETRRQAIGGSQTADNIADQRDMPGVDPGILASLMNFQFGTAAKQGIQSGVKVMQGQNEATRSLIAQALLSNNPQAALAPILRQTTREGGNKAVIEAMLRQAGLAGFDQIAR